MNEDSYGYFSSLTLIDFDFASIADNIIISVSLSVQIRTVVSFRLLRVSSGGVALFNVPRLVQLCIF